MRRAFEKDIVVFDRNRVLAFLLPLLAIPPSSMRLRSSCDPDRSCFALVRTLARVAAEMSAFDHVLEVIDRRLHGAAGEPSTA